MNQCNWVRCWTRGKIDIVSLTMIYSLPVGLTSTKG